MILQLLAKFTSKPIIIFLALLILVGILAQLILYNQLAESSGKLSQTLAEVENYERQNRDLAVQIYQKGSIIRLRELAASVGFATPEKFFFVRQNFLVAENLK